ncbi:O-methylsterigmatocystin oxidoreductase [Mycena indigotica]|uniref:O-methylsterigmatocystin oxidoreductase n=1 Tax=Mycena indigotica TaxID=2126181 RepID=A0A8H6SN17_9AGAR|nr:O-methylsterigmatocystin oxidoreductase [Mycena indigotica]KAF7302033.1 O-methylsterigmatocystin oxidoreductase [Mycena indigotica]
MSLLSLDSLQDIFRNNWILPGAAVATGLGVVLYLVVGPHSRRPLPPGPEISWFSRNGVVMPTAYAWLTFAEWQKKFGDVIYVNVFRNPILIINSQEAAFDLLEKRSAIYSSRPVRTMQTEINGFSWLFSGLPYGPWYKKHRTMFHNHFQAKVIPRYHDTLVDSAYTLLRNLRLSHTPEHLLQHLRRTTTAIVLSISYGHHVAEQGDEYVELADQALVGLSIMASPLTSARLWSTTFPFYIPAWFPGAQFKRDGARWRKLGLEMWNRPFEMVKARIAAGTAEPCLNDLELETLIKDVSATVYAGGSDTTLSTLLSFFLAMVLHPEVQERAFAEINTLIPDGDRLPAFSDREQLPYCDRIVQESLRWNPVGNIALAHYLTEDDEYRGWTIPKGTTVLANIWAMLHEPSRYPDPIAFNPDRFSDEQQVDGKNPTPEIAYGFGRRICPGRFLATETIWIIVVSVIATYKILRPLDGFGKEVMPEVAYTPGLFRSVFMLVTDKNPLNTFGVVDLNHLDIAWFFDQTRQRRL